MAIDSAQFAAAQRILDEAMKKIRDLGESGAVNSIYHLELALFPLTKKEV